MIRALATSLNSGATYALFGVCVVLTYRMAGTLNFATTAVGALSAFSMLVLVEDGVPIAQAAIVGLAMGAIIGGLIGSAFAIWFRDHEPLTRSAVTIALLLGLLAAGFRIFGDSPRASRPFLPGRYTEVAGVRITYDTMMAVVVTLVVATAASLLLSRTRVGVRLRAMAQDSVTAELNGVPVAALTTVVWGASGSLSALGAILVGPGRPAAFAPLVFMLMPGLAAALAGRFERVWPTLMTGFVVAFLEAYSARFSSFSRFRGTIPIIFILVLLLWQRRAETWDDAR
ncbi:branched-chain amino acid ABC transporter permease [Candidatus Poriferisocius sp.]|uniref:branched-chain amino acid ABC transporter permease n=1 Tax=Candidatus Poriferisocius sp. TaxID=3101276 RepID=UPI003B018C7D